jgi:hypothetical protein
MINRRKVAWHAAALAAGLPLAVFVAMVVSVRASTHDSGLGFMAGTLVGAVLVRGVALAGEKVLERSGWSRAAALLVGVLVVGGAIWAWARGGG